MKMSERFVIALEEHYSAPEIVSRIPRGVIEARRFRPNRPGGALNPIDLLPEIGAMRLSLMDESGVDIQVLSHGGPGADLVEGSEGLGLARDINDYLATKIATYPSRFAGFAHLPMRSPDGAAEELRRAVKDLGFVGAMVDGTSEGRFLDAPAFEPLLACACELDVPLYLHPHLPPEPVRAAYYAGLPPQVGGVFETVGWGWHAETAVHVLRLVLSGSLDRHRSLKLIIGHCGEMLPMMMARFDDWFPSVTDYLTRSVRQTILDQVWTTTSGFFTKPTFDAALSTFGLEKMMFSVDYPFAKNADGVKLLDEINLDTADFVRFTRQNAVDLLRLEKVVAARLDEKR
jgi:predicted TIM-barrel fold metal-dependent hydrolase